MSTSAAVLVAAIFIWIGMVLAISFLEAPVKFRAPGVTLPIGLGIGRLVFRALNASEFVLALIVIGAAGLDAPPTGAVVAIAVAVLALLAQLVAVRPRLTRRSDAVLAGTGGESVRSQAHLAYLALEIVKVVGLFVAGIAVLAGSVGGV